MDLEDDKILILFRTDPEKALGILYDKYFEYLSKEVFFILKDDEDTQDVIQDLFLSLWRNKEYLQNINTSLKLYLRKAAYNKSINKLKAKVHFHEIDNEIFSFENSDQHSEMIIAEIQQKITNAIDGLPVKCRTVFILSRYQDMTYKEIANELEISVKTVENQIGKALKILRNKLITDGGIY